MNSNTLVFDMDGSISPPPKTPRKRRTADLAPVRKEKDKDAPEYDVAMRSDLDKKLIAFQNEKSAKVMLASAFSTTLNSALRREYLAEPTVPVLSPNLNESINGNPICWMKLSSVGLEMGFTPEKAAEALECMLSAFHRPKFERLLFLVSGDRSSGLVTIHLGLQSMHGTSGQIAGSLHVWNGFAKSNWPGLSFTADEDVSLGFSAHNYKNATPASRPSVRVMTGIPACRNKESVAATIDKLASALSGRTWRYLVIAEPVDSVEIEKIVRTCRELHGRAESLKSFQVGNSANVTSSKTSSSTEGGSETTSERDPMDMAMAVVAGAALAGAASLAGIPPMPPFTAGFGAVLFGSKTKTSGSNWSETVSRSLSEAKGVSFSETIANKHAEAAAKLLEAHVERLQLSEAVGAWSVGSYFIGENEATADIGAHAIKAILSGDNSHWEPIRICKPLWRDGSDNVLPLVALECFDNPNIVPKRGGEILHHPLGPIFDSMRTLLNTRELVRMVNFPLSNIPGIPVRRISSELGIALPGKTGFDFATSMYRGDVLVDSPYRIDPSTLAKHSLVCGINGSGKTNTILGILGALLDDVDAPFLVVEPAKQEYVEWAVARNKKLIGEMGEVKARLHPKWINVYVPGREKWGDDYDLETLRLNPFDFVWLNSKHPPKTLEHIDRLKTVINAAMPMQEVLPILMEELIYMCYGVKGCPIDGKYPCWLPKSPNERYPTYEEKLLLPSFTRMASKLAALFSSRTYAKDVQLNLRAALATRIDSFKRGWRKELLNKDSPRNSREDWARLFERPTVINLTSLASDEDKAFFMSLLLLFIYEYRQECSELPDAPPPSRKAGKLRHLLVVEEAHRILCKAESSSPLSANPKRKVSEMFSNMISEVRAYGQGMLIADQIPCRLNEDAVKNTNLKIVHKLVSADDRSAMAVALNLWEDQERIIGDLGVGEALVRGDMDKQTVMVKVNKNV